MHRIFFGCLVPGLVAAQTPTSAPVNPLQDGGGAHKHSSIIITESLPKSGEAPDPFESNLLSLRGAEREFATLGLSSDLSLRVAEALPLRFSADAKVRVKEQTKDNQGRPEGNPALGGDYFSSSAKGALSLTKRLTIESGVKVSRAAFTQGSTSALTTLQPGVAALYQLGSRLQLHLRSSQLTNQRQSALDADETRATSQARATDIGGTYQGKYLYLEANTFHRQIIGVVEAVQLGEGQGVQLINVGDGFTSGMKTEQRLSLGFLGGVFADVSLWSTQTLLISRVDDGTGVERAIQGLPLFLSSSGLNYQREESGTGASFTATYAGERASGLALQPPQWLVDLSVRQRLHGGASWYASLENLTDAREALIDLDLTSGISAQDLPTIGRTFFTGLMLQWSPTHEDDH